MSRTTSPAPFSLPSPIAAKLASVRRRMTRVGALTAVAVAACVLLCAMSLAMGVDYLATLYDSPWRAVLTCTAIAAAFITLIVRYVAAGRRARRVEHVARQVDRRVPLLEERWSTVAEAAASGDNAATTHPAMLRHVADEAAGYDPHVTPRAVVPLGGLVKALLAVGAVMLVLLIAAVLNWRQTSVLFRRFWAPGSSISATVVTADPGDRVVARGEQLVLGASLSGAQADEARLTLRRSGGDDLTLTLIPRESRGDDSAAHVSHRLRSVDDDFQYRLRAGDGQTHWHAITVAHRPEIERVALSVTPPAYRHEEPLDLDEFPRRISTVDGGVLELAIKPKRKLKSLELRLDDKVVPLALGDDGWYHWRKELRSSFTFSPVLTEPRGLTLRRPPTTRVHVYQDQPPVVRIISPDEQVGVRPDETIEIAFLAEDDNGLGSAELVVYQAPLEPGGEPIELDVTPIPLGDDVGGKRAEGSVELDLSAYPLADGASLSYAIRVTESRGAAGGASANPGALADAPGGAHGRAAPTGAAPDSAGQSPSSESPPGEALADSATPATPDDEVSEEADGNAQRAGDGAQAPSDTIASSAQGADERERSTDAAAQAGKDAGEEASEPAGAGMVASASEGASDLASAPSDSGAPGPPKGAQPSTDRVALGAPRDGEASEGATPDEQTAPSSVGASAPGEDTVASSESTPSESDASPSARQTNGAVANQPGDEVATNAPEQEEEAGARARASDARSLMANNGEPPQEDTAAAAPIPAASGVDAASDEARPPTEAIAENSASPGAAGDASQTAGNDQPAASESQPQAGADGAKVAQSSESRSQSISAQMASARDNAAAQNGDAPPGDAMTRRALDVPQTSSSNTMRINVDKWAGSFEGQQREKLEIAIAPRIAEMRAQLERAHKLSRSVLDDLDKGQSWSARHFRDVNYAQDATKRSLTASTGLQDMTRDTPYAFIGLQLADIAEANVEPARDEFAAAHRAEDGARSATVRRGWQHVGRALDRLDELAGRFEAARREYALAETAQQVKQMYRVFLEDAFALLGEEPPEGSKFQRKMAEFELDEEYLERLREVLEMRRELAAELARILADDPRLRRRFMDNFRQRADSLRLQVTLLREQQEALTKESTIWSAMDGDKQPLALRILVRRRLEKSEDIARDVAKLADHFDAWMPLGDAQSDPQLASLKQDTEDLAAKAHELAAQAATAASDPEKLEEAVESGAALTDGLRRLDANLRALGGSAALAGSEAFAINRLAETRRLITDASGWTRGVEQFRAGAYHGAAAVEQYQLATDTDELAGKLGTVEQQIAAMLQTPGGRLPAELAEHARDLLAALDERTTPNQLASAIALRGPQWPRAMQRQQAATAGLIAAEKAFDALIEGAIERLDKMPVQDPIASLLDDPTLDELLAQLEQELPLEEALGIPNRPSNLQVIGDWLRPGQAGGGGGGGLAAMIAAQLRQQQQQMNRTSQQAQRRALRRLEDQKRVSRDRRPNDAGPEPQRTDWNVLVSKLDDDLLQGRDKLPPERYRTAIEQYYELIHSETSEADDAR